jgi:hypothetical protein
MSKKGRKNSTPKLTLNVTFSPDGAITVLSKFILGSHSFKNFFNFLESEIGKFVTNVEISCLFLLPFNSTIDISNFFVTTGAIIPLGYDSLILSNSVVSPNDNSLHLIVAFVFSKAKSKYPSVSGVCFGSTKSNSSNNIVVSNFLFVFGSFNSTLYSAPKDVFLKKRSTA